MERMTTSLIKAIEDAGYEWRSYSGRNMYGRHCVGVEIDDLKDLFGLGQSLPDVEHPSIDNMGRGYIVYWPRCEVEKED